MPHTTTSDSQARTHTQTTEHTTMENQQKTNEKKKKLKT